MRTAASGFLVGYLAIALLIAPSILWALRVTPDYGGGVELALKRSGMGDAVKRYGNQAAEVGTRWRSEIALLIVRNVFSPPGRQ